MCIKSTTDFIYEVRRCVTGSSYGNKKVGNRLTTVQGYIIAVTIFVIVYFLIIVDRKRFHIPIWASMLIGAILMLVFQVISLESAVKSESFITYQFGYSVYENQLPLQRITKLSLEPLTNQEKCNQPK